MEVTEAPRGPVASVRFTPDGTTVLSNLGLLQELVGKWEGDGFNLIARPDFREQANLDRELNQTREALTFGPIGSAIPNRGFGQADIGLFGLTYLQKITDRFTRGALHIQPGLRGDAADNHIPRPGSAARRANLARMGSVLHRNGVLAQGINLGWPHPSVATLRKPF